MSSPITLTITELAGLGDGVGYLDGQKIFVPYTVPGDTITARIVKTGKEFHTAELVHIISAGGARQAPLCKHFYQCGGCSLQHIKREAYETFKRNMLVQAVARAGLDSRVVAPVVYIGAGARRRTVLQVKNGQVGYYKAGSHTIFNVETCPILEKPLEALIPQVKTLLARMSYAKSITEIALSLSDTGMDMVIIAKGEAGVADLETLVEFAEKHGLSGISWQSGQGGMVPVIRRRAVTMQVTEEIAVTIPPASFQQATKAGQEAITKEIIAATSGARHILDLYAGCGGYSFAMAAYAKIIHAVEGGAAMVSAICDTARKHGVDVSAEQRDLVKRPFQPKELDKFDAVVINPPRNGAKAQAEYLADSKVPVIVMVSCNPVTFSTDAKILAGGGYTLERAVPIDQFTWSRHLELVAVFRRGG